MGNTRTADYIDTTSKTVTRRKKKQHCRIIRRNVTTDFQQSEYQNIQNHKASAGEKILEEAVKRVVTLIHEVTRAQV